MWSQENKGQGFSVDLNTSWNYFSLEICLQLVFHTIFVKHKDIFDRALKRACVRAWVRACVCVCARYVFSLVFPLLSARNSTTVAHGLSGIAAHPYSNEYGGIWYQTHPLHTVGVMLFQFSKKSRKKQALFLILPSPPTTLNVAPSPLCPIYLMVFGGWGENCDSTNYI